MQILYSRHLSHGHGYDFILVRSGPFQKACRERGCIHTGQGYRNKPSEPFQNRFKIRGVWKSEPEIGPFRKRTIPFRYEHKRQVGSSPQISLDKPLKRNTPLTEPRYRFDKTNDDLLHNTLKDSLSNIDTNITTQDELEELAVTLCDKLMKAVDTSTPKVYSRNDPKSPISQAILDLIKEKRRLRRLYNNTQDPNTKSTINKLQKEIRTRINQESTISWEKFCNSISLESDPKKSWCKITNFLKPKGPRSYPTLKLGNKTAKTNPEKAQLFAESVERNFGIESHLFSKSQFDRVNKFVEAHSYHFTPLNSLYDSITDTDDDSDLVADVDPDTLIRIVRTELKNGKAPGIDMSTISFSRRQ